jgi:hypothetical protein
MIRTLAAWFARLNRREDEEATREERVEREAEFRRAYVEALSVKDLNREHRIILR